jgi:nitrogen fixation/metabolism regulation signal transduction histidine kinase
MAHVNYYLNVLIRVLLITVSCMGFAFTYYGSKDYFTLFNLGLLILIQCVLFIHYLNRTNRDLVYFFDSIKNEDSSISFHRGNKKLHRIYKLMDDVNSQIKDIRIKYAAQDQYFKTIIENIQTGLITFGPDGHIDTINKAARSLLGVNAVHRIGALNRIEKGMGDTLQRIKPAEKSLIRFNKAGETVYLSVNNSIIKLVDKELKIITLYDIKPELDKKELESWQKLIRILNHEIMNSLAPIMSTATTLKNYLELKNGHDNTVSDYQGNRNLKKIVSGLSIIYERSEGLKSFVENYKMLNTLPRPVSAPLLVRELFDNCKLLFNEELQTCRIKCISEVAAPGMELTADKSLVQQIMLNLLKNSFESLSVSDIEHKTIKLRALYNDTGKIVLQVADNGKGIPAEIIDQIFIPFFTTKEKGSGIGLNLCRQIMLLHDGTMAVDSVPYRETVFSIIF